MKRLALLIAFLLAAAPARAADAYASDWVKGLQSSARLIAAGGEQSGPLRAGVEITLEGKAATYWRAPGDAGVPPLFHFGTSRNLGKVEVLYPAPQKIDESGAEIFGYQRGVIFPLRVMPADSAQPVTLDLTLDYAACDRICVPAQAHLTLALPAASSPPGPHSGRIALAEAQVPRRQEIGAAAPLGLRAATRAPLTPQGGKPGFALEIAAPEGAAVDVFPEAPDYFFLKAGPVAKAGGGIFRVLVTVEDSPKDAPEVEASFTITANGEAIEVTKRLDLGAPKP